MIIRLIALGVGVALVMAGVGLLRAIEVVVGSRRFPQPGRRRTVLVFGWVLVALGILPIVVPLVNLTSQVPFLDEDETAAAVALAIVAGLVLAGGALLIWTGTLIGAPNSGGREPASDWRLNVLGMVGWLLVVLGGLIVLGVVFGGLFIAPGILVLVGILIVLARHRSSQMDGLLWVLAIAAHKQMPLAPGIEMVADQARGRFRRRVLALADRVNSGVALPDALDRTPRVLADSAGVAARIGWESGRLGAALRDAAIARAIRQPFWDAEVFRLIYLWFVVFTIQAVAGWIIYIITPRFRAIFQEFGLEPPSLTRIAFALNDLLVATFLVPVLLVLTFVVLLWLPLAYFDWVNWNIPVIDRLFQHRDTALILRALTTGVEGGRPLAATFQALARWYPKRWVRRRLARVASTVQEGSDWSGRLWAAGLIGATDVAVLESAERVGNLSWALRELAESHERRFGYRLQAWTQVLFPIVVMGLGALVFLIAVAYFSPLVKLIEELAG